MNKEIIHKEIDLIQACISRMANNSFLIKGWCISLIAVILALSKENINPIVLCFIILIPLFSFWYLDAYFLRTERMYRKMYGWVLKKRSKGDSSFLYDLNPLRFEKEVDSKFETMVSETLRWFYGVPTIIVIGILIYQLGCFLIPILLKKFCS